MRYPGSLVRGTLGVLEFASVAAPVFHRAGGQTDWTATVRTAGDMPGWPEIAVTLAIGKIYEGIDLAEAS